MNPIALEAFRLSETYQQLKAQLHRYLILLLEQQKTDIATWQIDRLERWVWEHTRRYASEQRLALNTRELEHLSKDTRDELVGFGPIQPLIDDDSIDDIVVNGATAVFVERQGRLQSVPVRFVDDAHILRVISRILSPIGRRLDESTPMVDARLPNGARVNAIIPPIALNGPCLSVRKFRKKALGAEELVGLGTCSHDALAYLRQQVEQRVSLLVAGGTGSGKTTFLNVLSQWIPESERVITIEDAAELRLQHGHVVRLETRPPNLDGNRAVTARDLVRNALRMRPDRLLVGEVRGEEVLDMLQAMNTGHEGSMTTLHANSVRDVLPRLQLLAGFAGYNGSESTLRQQIATAIPLLVYLQRYPDGKRRVQSITRLIWQEEAHTLGWQEIFQHQPTHDALVRL
jgi:pilus assembly protein CpaF